MCTHECININDLPYSDYLRARGRKILSDHQSHPKNITLADLIFLRGDVYLTADPALQYEIDIFMLRVADGDRYAYLRIP